MERRTFLAVAGATALAGCTTGIGSGDTPEEEPPTETPTEAPTDTPEPAEQIPSQSFSASGTHVSDRFTVQDGLTVFEIEHDGEADLEVDLIDGNGETVETLVDATGEYEGRVPVPLSNGEYFLNVDADGIWKVVVRQPRWTEYDASALPQSATGQFADYFGPVEFTGSTAFDVYSMEAGHMSLVLRTQDGEEIAVVTEGDTPYETTATTEYEGIGLVHVDTDEAYWEIDVTEN